MLDIVLLLASGLQQVTGNAGAPATAGATAQSTIAAPTSATRNYVGCIRSLSGQYLSSPDPTSHVDAVLAACEPSLPPAVVEFVTAVRADPGQAKLLAEYKAKHHADLDLAPATTTMLRNLCKAAALHILSREPGQFNGKLAIHFDSDGVKP